MRTHFVLYLFLSDIDDNFMWAVWRKYFAEILHNCLFVSMSYLTVLYMYSQNKTERRGVLKRQRHV